MLHMDEYNAVT